MLLKCLFINTNAHAFSLFLLSFLHIMDSVIDHLPLSWLPLPATQSALSDVARACVSNTSFEQEFEELKYAPWRFSYLDYYQLKRDITTISLSLTVAKRFETEWSKVNIKDGHHLDHLFFFFYKLNE